MLILPLYRCSIYSAIFGEEEYLWIPASIPQLLFFFDKHLGLGTAAIFGWRQGYWSSKWQDPNDRESQRLPGSCLNDSDHLVFIWVCLKMLCTPKPNGFADHYPDEKMAISLGIYSIFRLRLGFLYPPTQVSTATSQGCLYSCDACTLRAVHLLSHSPQPADFTWTAGCTRDKATAIGSIFLCQGRLFLFCSPGWGNLQVLVWRISFYPQLQSPTSPIPGGGPATQTFPSVQPSTWR